MKILVCGGRDFDDDVRLRMVLSQIDKVSAVVHGGCKVWSVKLNKYTGADFLAGEWATANGIAVHEHPAKWKLLGPKAGPIRNQEMLDQHPDLSIVVAFPGGRGTADMIKRARAKGVPTWEIPRQGEVKRETT